MNAQQHVQPSGRRLDPGLRIRFRPDADAGAGRAQRRLRAGPKTIGVPTNRRYSTALIVLNAKGGQLAGDKLILDGVRRPRPCSPAARSARCGHMATPEMVELWRTGSFAKDPPNATVSVFAKDGSSVADVVVVLKSAKLEGEKLTFDVAGAGRQPGQGRWAGLGVHRHDLVRRRLQRLQLLRHEPDHRRRDARHRQPHDTSTFSGWSNPSPTHPYVPPPRDYGTAVGAPPPPELDPRIQQRYNQPTCGRPPLLPCY